MFPLVAVSSNKDLNIGFKDNAGSVIDLYE